MRRPDVFTLDYSHPLAQGLVLASMLRRGRDESLRNLHGTIVNIPNSSWYIDPEIGRHAVLFSGGTDHIAHPYKLSAVDFGNGGTYAAWLNFGTTSTDEYNGSWNAPRVYLGKQGQTHVFGWGSSFGYGIANAATPNVWGHLALTNNGSSSIFYVNGRQVGTASQTFSGIQANNFGVGLCIGVGRPMRGPVSDTVLYNRALSPAEIAILADRTDPMLGGLVVEERPVLYFDMGGSTTDALTASDLVVGSPVLGAPSLGQVHALTATGITTSAPVLGSPALGQVHSLTASDLVAGAPVLGTPSLIENAADVDALTAADFVVGSPALGTPALDQIHVLGSDGLVTGSPVLGSPSITQIHTLEAMGLTVGVPVLGTPVLNGVITDLQVRAELNTIGSNQHAAQSFGTFNTEFQSYGTTSIELICIANFEVNELGE